MPKFKYFITLFLFLVVIITSCKKISENIGEKPEDLKNQEINFSRGGGGNYIYDYTNLDLLKLVRTGVGGYVNVDSSCNSCTADTFFVNFPSYTPPVNNGGILSFSTSNDYNLFVKAANLMEDLWIYSNEDFEDTPNEIYHLGEESLNSLDSLCV